jgi:transcription initiation factor IIE alpha subunit
MNVHQEVIFFRSLADKGEFACDPCNSVVQNEKNSDAHKQANHLASDPFKCDHCDQVLRMSFTSFWILKDFFKAIHKRALLDAAS